MNLPTIKLNLYSFGYAAGFFAAGLRPGSAGHVGLTEGVALVEDWQLAGIEFPYDFFFQDDLTGLAFLDGYKKSVYLDFESMDVPRLIKLIPEFKRRGMTSVRVKMNHLDKVFYGGNRYTSPRFNEAVAAFTNELRALVPVLADYQFKVMIENHQDLSSVDLAQIIETTSPVQVGINWDIGNSLAVGDTVDSFFARLGPQIGNVHLKDYRVVTTAKGFKLVRCALGDGAVDFSHVFGQLKTHKISTCSIELGAHISRECDVATAEYWSALGSSAPLGKKEFLSHIGDLARQGSEMTVYETGAPPEAVVASEKEEVAKSVAFLRTLGSA